MVFSEEKKAGSKTTEKVVGKKKNVGSNKKMMTKKSHGEKFKEYMRSHYAEKGAVLSHTSMIEDFRGSYNIPENESSQFIKLYCRAINEGNILGIIERHVEYGPIVIDIDITSSNVSKRQYDENLIKEIVHAYNRIIRKYLEPSMKDMKAYITEKKRPDKREGKFKDGFHIYYPFICTNKSLQYIMRDDLIKYIKKNDLFGNIDHCNSIEDIIDKSVIASNGMIMYGSQKSKLSQVYILTHIYEEVLLGKPSDCIFPNYHEKYFDEIVSVLSIRKFGQRDQTPLRDDVNVEKLDSRSRKIMTKKNNFSANTEDYKIGILNELSTEEEKDEVNRLVKMLSIERASEYNTWYQVGSCIHNIDHTLLKSWIRFSKKCPEKFKEGECEYLWARMKPNNYGIASLHHMAMNDNPDEYRKYRREIIREKMNDIECSHHEIASVANEKYKYRFICSSVKHKTWYEFDKHRWVQIDDGYAIKNLLSRDLTKDFKRKMDKVVAKMSQKNSKKNTDEFDYIGRIIKKLNDNGFKESVMKEYCSLAYDREFLDKIDENTNLLCFKNGVYDLELDKFRKGYPDDYITISTGYNFCEIDEDDEVYQEVMEFLEKVQPVKRIRDYMLTVFSTCLSGEIRDESFYVFTGSGANGKSKIMDLLSKSLGDYWKSGDIRILTEKRGTASSASPEIADKKGVRACSFDEPEAFDTINTGFMKLLTGGDKISARKLYGDPVYFKPQFKPFLLCNKLPGIRSDDDGTWRRIKVVHFQSKFHMKSKLTRETINKMEREGLPKNNYWADEDIPQKIMRWKNAFITILLKYYRIYKVNGLIPPEEVMKYTDEYRRRCDVYQDFIGDCLTKTENKADIIKIPELHQHLRLWFKTTGVDGKCPSTKELSEYFNKKTDYYVKKNKMEYIIYHKFRTDDDDDIIDELENVDCNIDNDN